MKSFVAFIAVLVMAVSADGQEPDLIAPRVAGGRYAAEGQFPWQVGIHYVVNKTDTKRFCSGALIADTWVLTAAQCVADATNFTIILGTTKRDLGIQREGRLEVWTMEKHPHEAYNPGTNSHDIALLKLRQKVVLTHNIRTISLSEAIDYISPKVEATVVGWGADSKDPNKSDLRYRNVTTISNQACKASLPGEGIVIKQTLCAIGPGICEDDVGSTMVTTNSNGETVHTGVLSFGFRDDRCSSYNQPITFIRTASYRDWITSKTDVSGSSGLSSFCILNVLVMLVLKHILL